MTTEIAEDGSDLIFITGAPGSRWSAIARAMSYADEINNSDESPKRRYSASAADPLHFGNYFGPGMEFGHRFDVMDQLSKNEIMSDLARPYQRSGGVKLLKAHLFSRHVDLLAQLFPRAHFVFVYRPDDKCLSWWLEAGGFDISFPDYSWYREIDNIRNQIVEDNRCIRQVIQARGLKLRRLRSFHRLLDALGLHYSPGKLANQNFDDRATVLGFTVSSADGIEQQVHRLAQLAQLAYM